MRWQFEITDVPASAEYPIIGYQTNDSGVRKGPYYYRVEDLIKALQQTPENVFDADGHRNEEKSTPPLPLGCVRYSSNDSESRQRVTMIVDKKIWEIRYGEDKEFFSIGFPKMILQYLVVPSTNNGFKVSEMRIFAIQDSKEPVRDETLLYTFPYPNVGKSNGIVCWGLNQRLEIKDILELERAFRWFIAAPFNEDHGVRTTLGISKFRALIEHIKEQPFDDEWLMPSNMRFGDLFKK